MKAQALHLAANVLVRTGALRSALRFCELAAACGRRGPRGRTRAGSVQILSYHRVNDESMPVFPAVPVRRFRREMELLRRHFDVRPLGELVSQLLQGDVPARAVALTFDDGYRDNYTCAFPVLRELKIPATVFLATGAIDGGPPLWHDLVFDAFCRTREVRLNWHGNELSIATLEDKRTALQAVLARLRTLPAARREEECMDLRRKLGCDDSCIVGFEKLTWDEIRIMAKDGVEFGAHTVTHPILSRLSFEEQEREIGSSKEVIEKNLGKVVDLFAYPNGGRGDFDARTKKVLQERGFRAAVTTIRGVNRPGCDRFELKRLELWDRVPELSALRLAWYGARGV